MGSAQLLELSMRQRLHLIRKVLLLGLFRKQSIFSGHCTISALLSSMCDDIHLYSPLLLLCAQTFPLLFILLDKLVKPSQKFFGNY
jgi:hypothetical protein